MANISLIILTLIPSKPTAADKFRDVLDGLTIKAFDQTFSGVETALGTATGLVDLGGFGDDLIDVTQKQIFQHWEDKTEGGSTSRTALSGATAVIVVDPLPNHPEYPDPTAFDIRLEITHASQAILDRRIEFNIHVTDSEVTDRANLSKSKKFYAGAVESAYVTLPPNGAGFDPTLGRVDLPEDGSPPPFDQVVAAIDLVLAKDPGATTLAALCAANTPLTAAQSKYVASEIVWNRTVFPPPEPKLVIPAAALLYTTPTPDIPGVSSDQIDQARAQFEADRSSYYATNDGEVVALAGFVFSASAAVLQELMSIRAARAVLDLPLIIDPAATTVPTAQLALQPAPPPAGGTPTPLGFVVPAAVFYALSAAVPNQVDAGQRYDTARLAGEARTLAALATAVDAGVIGLPVAAYTVPTTPPPPTFTGDQAARRLAALGGPQSGLPIVTVEPPIDVIINGWLGYQGASTDIDDAFWDGVVTGQKAAYLRLVLDAITNTFDPLIAAIGTDLGVHDVAGLIALTDQQWRDFFATRPQLLPDFTKPGTPAERAEAFIRHLRTFFTVHTVNPTGPTPAIDAPPTLPGSGFDAIAEFLSAYPARSGGAEFSFTTVSLTAPGVDESITAAAADVFPGDPAAAAWLHQAIVTITELWQCTAEVGDKELHFSLTEALYARGFSRIGSIAALSLADFTYALTGSVAYPYAADIYRNAQGSGGTPVEDPGEFNPVNPEGALTDCIPPEYLSPLGPVQYLAELLQISAASTCEQPLQPGDVNRLGALLASRRGPLGQLAATAANLHTPVPALDLVNESLEAATAAVAAQTAPAGAVHDTAGDFLDGHALATGPDDIGGDPWRHDPQTLFAAIPEYSSPATPVAAPGAYKALRSDFTAPGLPYSQPLDVNRSYLEYLRTSRFSVMRVFRHQITEFALDAEHEPADFAAHQWRYPLRLPIALEYLRITPDEYQLLFTQDLADKPTQGQLSLPEVYGFPGTRRWTDVVSQLPEFLTRTGLTYCEFLDLWRSGYVPFRRRTSEGQPSSSFPDCEPCCLDDIRIDFGRSPAAALRPLAVFIRLWRRLRDNACATLTFADLADVATDGELFRDGSVNPDFIRQLASFTLLRELLCLPLRDPDYHPPTDSEVPNRVHLLALWQGPDSVHWTWAVRTLLDNIERVAHCLRPDLEHQPELTKLLPANLDPLSVLAGFDPAVPGDTWWSRPAATLRFVEWLVKLEVSQFTVGEVLYLFADQHLDGDDPFELQSANDAADDPLELPDDADDLALWELRRELLEIEVGPGEAAAWTWTRIATTLADTFGYDPATSGDPLTAVGTHSFPSVLAAEGIATVPGARRFTTPLAAADTDPAMWNTPPGGPFRHNGSDTLWTELPLRDAAVLDKLAGIRQLSGVEQTAVQTLYFAPRAVLAPFALLFDDFEAAVDRLVSAADEQERFAWFQRQFARFHHRCHRIVDHLTDHVNAASDEQRGHLCAAETWRLLRSLWGDENAAAGSSWEADPPPAVTWPVRPTGGAFAALLGLVGTGLLGEYRIDEELTWREIRRPMVAFGVDRDRANAPVPTVIPSLDLSLDTAQRRFAEVRNGFAFRDSDGEPLFGAQPFTVTWSGSLLVETPGWYEFAAGAPVPDGQTPDPEACPGHRWRVRLGRGQKTWLLLDRDWPDTDDAADYRSGRINLRRGVYAITIDFAHTEPTFAGPGDIRPRHTGFDLKYRGPDTDRTLVTIPARRLYRDRVDAPLGVDLDSCDPAVGYLRARYTSSLRDIRGTYQRAYKAALLVHRFGLSAHPLPTDPESELSYLLEHAETFAGTSHPRTGSDEFGTHRVWFDPNLLPVDDPYLPPDPGADQRSAPSAARIAAFGDLWERLHDYVQLRADTYAARQRPAWRLFYEAAENQPDLAAELVRHLGIDAAYAETEPPLALTYFDTPEFYTVTSADLTSEAWAIRVQRAALWLDAVQHCFTPVRITDALPATWAADDPAAMGDQGESLTDFVRSGCVDNGAPRRYEDLRGLDDELRLRARTALIAYLCGMDRVPLPYAPGEFARRSEDLGDVLLQDIDTGTGVRASRIEEAISAVHGFVQRTRLGLEPDFVLSPELRQLWEDRFATFRQWQRCTERDLYRENWIEWDELARARRVDAFHILETELRRGDLTVATPTTRAWWPADPAVGPLARATRGRRASTTVALLTPGPIPENLDLLATPDAAAQFDALAPIPDDEARLPLWIRAAIRLGGSFVRLAAAGEPVDALEGPCPPDVDSCCGCAHPHTAGIDEYYFWLQTGAEYPAFWTRSASDDPPIPQNADIGVTDADETSDWHRPETLPALLDWPPVRVVYLHWSRLHRGEFQPPRRCADPIIVDPSFTEDPRLRFLGRTADSLRFDIVDSAQAAVGVRPTGYTDPVNPGFRYDLATDSARALPLLVPPGDPAPGPGGLDAYPRFAFTCPGAPVEPLTPFAVATTVAGALRADCRFDSALDWYALVRPPLAADNGWTDCDRRRPPTDNVTAALSSGDGDTCCATIAPSDDRARQRAILLAYLETMLDWADAYLCRNTPEGFRQADVLLDTIARILGARPVTVVGQDDDAVQTVDTFTPRQARLNPRLIALYDRTADRAAMVSAGLTERRYRNGRPDTDMPYFGADSPRAPGCACGAQAGCCCDCEPYRFTVLVGKAAELAAEARTLANALLSAYEKGDAEYLAGVRAAQELQLLELTLSERQNAVRDADWQVQALDKTKQGAQRRLRNYLTLLSGGLNSGEQGYQSLTGTAIGLRTGGTAVEAVAQAVGSTPDIFNGVAGFGGTPLFYMQLPIGTKLAGVFASGARLANSLGEIASTSGGLELTEGNWDRRQVDWQVQSEVTSIEIEQIERQILGAERRRDQALRELDNYRRQIDNSRAVQDFLRDKFTADQLYLYLQRETAALYRQAYRLAHRAARQAERAFNYERGYTTRTFVPGDAWDTLHDGLLAADRLVLAVRSMDKAYIDENCREYELTKHISLRLHFPREFLRLQRGHAIEIEIPEWMFDLDYPGHYLRRIKDITVTIPCVTGPYSGVHCRLTQLSHSTRIDPRLTPAAHGCCTEECTCDTAESCCCAPEPDPCHCSAPGADGYTARIDDPRIVRAYTATEAIATSSGQNDSGLFELSFRDERYLPFEFAGAVSRWRIELPTETNYFDFDTLADVVLHVNYTAREGGDPLRTAAAAAARSRLPGDGQRLIDVRHDQPDVWNGLRGGRRELELRLFGAMFPFVPGKRVRSVDRVEILLEAPCAEPSANLTVWFLPHGHHCCDGACDCDRILVRCIAASEYPGLFWGEVDLTGHRPLGPISADRPTSLGTFVIPEDAGTVCDAYLLLDYCAEPADHCGDRRACRCGDRGVCGCGTCGCGHQSGRGHDR
ncbi:neuraminidase-like domain-containing protein [Nocardia sp. NPDC051570]|uniref:Tc toxin subunit A-related protein n=1 Tax=Nocardia sp. NPDC051570 TaxID=3364324 RepID=UPI0037A8F8C2